MALCLATNTGVGTPECTSADMTKSIRLGLIGTSNDEFQVANCVDQPCARQLRLLRCPAVKVAMLTHMTTDELRRRCAELRIPTRKGTKKNKQKLNKAALIAALESHSKTSATSMATIHAYLGKPTTTLRQRPVQPPPSEVSQLSPECDLLIAENVSKKKMPGILTTNSTQPQGCDGFGVTPFPLHDQRCGHYAYSLAMTAAKRRKTSKGGLHVLIKQHYNRFESSCVTRQLVQTIMSDVEWLCASTSHCMGPA